MTEFIPDPDKAIADVETRISDMYSPLGRDTHVRRVVEELDPNDQAPLWHPSEEGIKRAQVERVVDQVIRSIANNWYTLHPEVMPSIQRPAIERATHQLIGRSQGTFSHLTLARIAISKEREQELQEKYPTTILASLRHFEIGAAVYGGRKVPTYSSVGLLALARPNLAPGRTGTSLRVGIVPSTGAAELRAKTAAAAAKASAREHRNLKNPLSGGLPGTKRH